MRRKGSAGPVTGRARAGILTILAPSSAMGAELFERRPLPGSAEGWSTVARELSTLPATLLARLADTGLALADAVRTVSVDDALLVLALAVAAIVLVVRGTRILDRVTAFLTTRLPRFASRAVDVPLRILRANLGLLGMTVFVAVSTVVLGVPLVECAIATGPLALWLVARSSVGLARELLVAEAIPVERRHPVSYRQLRLFLPAAAVVGGLWGLARASALAPPAEEVVDRVALLFVVLGTPPARNVAALVREVLERRYPGAGWLPLAVFLTRVTPFVIPLAALLGVVGYVNLAREIAVHLAVFLAVVAGCVIANGLLRDAIAAFFRVRERRAPAASEVARTVADSTLRVIAFAVYVGGAWLLTHLWGWDADSLVGRSVLRVVDTPIVSIGTAPINLRNVGLTLLAVLVLVWVGRWSRALTERLLRGQITDVAIRHSLTVLIQYAVVLVGILVTLQSIGIDVTTLTVFAGALGVGLGFGLQNVANNFVSGLLILLERPLRTGDIVTIGQRDGTVTRIGIRSLTMRTFDREEVIIPNAEVISNAFINWTHTDNVKRTILYVGVSYGDDPHAVRETMLKIVQDHSATLSFPAPNVFLWEFADSAVVYRVQYYIDCIRSDLFVTQNEVMFGIWDALKAAGFTIPFPQRDLHIRSTEGLGPFSQARDGADAGRDAGERD